MLAELGLLVLYVCLGTSAVVIAAAVLSRVNQLPREWSQWAQLRERELDQSERRMELDRRELGLQEREIVLDEQEAAEDRDEDLPHDRPHF